MEITLDNDAATTLVEAGAGSQEWQAIEKGIAAAVGVDEDKVTVTSVSASTGGGRRLASHQLAIEVQYQIEVAPDSGVTIDEVQDILNNNGQDITQNLVVEMQAIGLLQTPAPTPAPADGAPPAPPPPPPIIVTVTEVRYVLVPAPTPPAPSSSSSSDDSDNVVVIIIIIAAAVLLLGCLVGAAVSASSKKKTKQPLPPPVEANPWANMPVTEIDFQERPSANSVYSV